MAMRIWLQSFTDLSELSGYSRMLEEHARLVCRPDTVVDVHGVRPGTYPEGTAPIEALRYPWVRHLLDLQVVENAVRAESEGYDAVAVTCFYDPGLEAARGAVGIPVASICESTLLVARSIGKSFAFVGLENENVAFLRGLVHHYGFESSLARLFALDPPMTEPELDRAFEGSPEFVRRFEELYRKHVLSSEADVIVPAEGVLNTALLRNGVREIDGIPVMDAYAALLAHTEMLIQLRRATGLEASRSAYGPLPPPALISHLRDVTMDVFRENSG